MQIFNIVYFIYIKFTSILFRLLKWISSRYPEYQPLLNDMGHYDKDFIMSRNIIQSFKYDVIKYIPNKLLYTLVQTQNTKVDLLFLMRLYKTIINIPEFKELGTVKIVLICTYEDKMFSLASSFPINEDTTPQQFITHYFLAIIKLSIKAYNVDSFDILLVKAFNADHKEKNNSPYLNRNVINNQFFNQTRKFSTKVKLPSTGFSIINKDLSLKEHPNFIGDNFEKVNLDPRRFILPLQSKEKQMTRIATFDIETFVYNGKLYPYAIGLQYTKYNKTHKIIFYYEDLYQNIEENSAAILEKMVDHITKNCKHYTIFAHNLGKFDGILMMSSIFKVLGKHSIIIGKDNSIIAMSFKGIKMLDSLRIFPMSLKQLAKQFKVETQKGEFDYRKVNKDNVTSEAIKMEVLSYLEKDISSLYECMVEASNKVYNNYHFNISDVFSASSLSMKHYRTNYLDKHGIPLIPKHIKDIISEAYFGGISQVYKTYGNNLHYYDINSMYPWAMTQEMPYEYLGYSNNPKLKDCFGFVYASIYVPESLKYKPLPVRMDNILATPSGNILGVYFSEELKYAETLGCQITPHKAYLFSKKILFREYVEDMYKLKSISSGSERVFVKLLLNGLYGFFARTDEKHIAIFLPLDEAIKQAQIYPMYNLVVMDDDNSALLIREVQPSKELCNITGQNFVDNFDIHNRNRTKSNRAIAAAITAYSRIKIHQFKDICGDIYYSDTDSIVSGNVLDDRYLNSELGMMKDEFKGSVIEEGIFLSPKLYALKLDNGEEIIKARGVPKEISIKISDGEYSNKRSLTFEDLINVHRGNPIEYKVEDRLFRSLNDLGITSKDVKGILELNVSSGKVAIYGEDNLIVGYKDIHKNLLTAIKESNIQYKLSGNLAALINKYKVKFKNLNE